MSGIRTTAVLAGLAVAGVASAPLSPARAAPFGFASNQITNFAVTSASGGSVAPSAAQASVVGLASFGGFVPSAFTTSSGSGAALAPAQVFSGPGPAPPPNFFAPPAGATPPTGTRALANIGAGNPASGGITISDAAGGFGGATGSGGSSSSATTQFQIVGAGQSVQVTFDDLIQLVAATAGLVGETSTATIYNVFSITNVATGVPLASFAPAELNQQITSTSGTPARNTVGPTQFSESYVSPVLSSGVLYRLDLTSAASEAIQGGSAVQVPEPASLALLGAALCGWLVFRRRAAG